MFAIGLKCTQGIQILKPNLDPIPEPFPQPTNGPFELRQWFLQLWVGIGP